MKRLHDEPCALNCVFSCSGRHESIYPFYALSVFLLELTVDVCLGLGML